LQSSRSQKVGESIHKEISELLIKGLKDPRVGFVTVTGVEVTPDLHLARVYFTVFGDDKQRKDSQKGLQSAVPFLRRELAKRLRMRYVPDLLFQFDASLEYGNRIESLIRDIHESDSHDERDPDDN
jgi:ribosome-binding factor A